MANRRRDRRPGPVRCGARRHGRTLAGRAVGTRTEGHAGRIAGRKSKSYERVGSEGKAAGPIVCRTCPTVTARTVRVAAEPRGQGAHYWVTSGYFQSSLPRGLSVYRNLTSFVPAAKVGVRVPNAVAPTGLFAERPFDLSKATYRVPNAIEVTVASALDCDDPDRIAQLVASLRYGYGHTPAATSLPAPVSFEGKARDYMTRFGLDEADAEDTSGDGTDGGSIPAEPQTDAAIDVEFEEEEEGGPDNGGGDKAATDMMFEGPSRAFAVQAQSWEEFVRRFSTDLTGTTALARMPSLRSAVGNSAL